MSMIRKLSRTFMRGIFTLLPLLLTVYLLHTLLSTLASFSDKLLRSILPEAAVFPGAGLVLGLVVVFCIGALMGSRIMQRLYELIELPFRRLPFVRDLYIAIKQLADYLRPSDGRTANRVVTVRMPESPVEMIGFLMRDDFDDMPDALKNRDRVVVYLPLSYQIGGLTLFLPRDWVTPVDIGVDDAMRGVLTAWVQQSGPR